MNMLQYMVDFLTEYYQQLASVEKQVAQFCAMPELISNNQLINTFTTMLNHFVARIEGIISEFKDTNTRNIEYAKLFPCCRPTIKFLDKMGYNRNRCDEVLSTHETNVSLLKM